eukprot:TRINITY_DN1313_c0_g1_i2.p1 TRINITY_DN1313_c0_g1~~TRINITY_DN1313_c0_g1_i2.p1  ORF type:complete len:580 (+),score=132.33 TRINITY_DN1313_c0_g1_i2:161-1900(+)
MKNFSLAFLFTLLVACVFGLSKRSYDQHDFYKVAQLNADWSSHDSFYAPAYHKDYNEIVRLRGVAVHKGPLPSIIFTLPEGLRPRTAIKIRVGTFSDFQAYTTGVVNISSNGQVIALEGHHAFSLDAVSFSVPTKPSVLAQGNTVSLGLRFPKPDSSCVSFWERYWSPRDPTVRACHEIDLDDEILLTGTIAPPRADIASRLVGILDRPQRPNKDLRICAPSSQGPVVLLIQTTGDIFVRGYRGGNVYLDGVSYIKNQVSNWRMINSWANGYSEAEASWFVTDSRFQNVYTTPGFRKDSEGRIFLKGIVAPPKPFSHGVMFTLPEGFRPSETVHRCGATRRGSVTVAINPQGEVSIENIAGSEYIDWLSLDGMNFLSSEIQGELIVPETTLNHYDVDTLFTSVEGSFTHGQNIVLSRPPLRTSAYFAFVKDTPVLAQVYLDGSVKLVEFPRVESDNVLIGNDWKAISYTPKAGAVTFESPSERPAFMIDRNNNILVLRGLFPFSTESSTLFELPSWIAMEKDVLLVAAGHKSYYPIVVRQNGLVEWVGEMPESDTLILLDGLHFPVVCDKEPSLIHLAL